MNRRSFLKAFGLAPLVVASAKQEVLRFEIGAAKPRSPEKGKNVAGVLRLVTHDEKQIEVWRRNPDGTWEKNG